MSIRKQSTCVNRAVVAFLALAVLFIGSTTASAQFASKKTTVTFADPVEIPGVNAQVLPAGVYVFRLLDSLSDRHIVQVFNKDESHIYATILAIPNYRLRATDKTVMTFAERAEGDPQAIRAWFYPGDNWATPSWSTTDSSADGPRGLSVRPSLMKPIDPDQLARLLSDGA